MSRKKVSTTVYITPEQDARLKALHERTKVPVAEYIAQQAKLLLPLHDPSPNVWSNIQTAIQRDDSSSKKHNAPVR